MKTTSDRTGVTIKLGDHVEVQIIPGGSVYKGTVIDFHRAKQGSQKHVPLVRFEDNGEKQYIAGDHLRVVAG